MCHGDCASPKEQREDENLRRLTLSDDRGGTGRAALGRRWQKGEVMEVCRRRPRATGQAAAEAMSAVIGVALVPASRKRRGEGGERWGSSAGDGGNRVPSPGPFAALLHSTQLAILLPNLTAAAV